MDIEFLKSEYASKKEQIHQRLKEFEGIGKTADNEKLFEEMCFCVLTANTSAKMGIKSIATIKTDLPSGSQQLIAEKLTGIYRFPNKRSEYILYNREYLEKEHNFEIRKLLESFESNADLRDFLAASIKGLGFKETSHFLRNIGYKGLCILDKHIINCMFELGLLDEAKAPKNRDQYLAVETKLKNFSNSVNIDIDEMDLLLWSIKTGEILK